MKYPIYIYGSPVLRKVAENITPEYPSLEKFISDMFETLYNSEGVGLAAPQIGKSINLFVVDASHYEELDLGKKVFINAEIYERGGEEIAESEGCLSVPGINEKVWRPDRIRIRYADENFRQHDEEYSGYAARIIQHEHDHIEGRMFVDHLSPLRKTLIANKLSAIAKGKYSAAYKVRQA